MISDKDDNNGWQEWRHHIIIELKRLNNNLEKLEAKSAEYMLNTSIEVSRLRVWSVVYGSIGGGIMVLLLKGVIDKLW